MTYLSLSQVQQGFETFKMGFQIVVVLAEVLCFIEGLTLFANAPAYKMLTDEEQTFSIWVVCEIFHVICIVSGNVLFLFVRACKRDSYALHYDNTDEHTDFLASEDTQIVINNFNTFVCPVLLYVQFYYYFEEGDLTDGQRTVFKE